MDLPKVALVNFPDTRVAFIIMLFRGLLANNFLLSGFRGRDTDFEKLHSSLSEEDMKSMQEMEAVTSVCYEYSADEAQHSNAFNNSLLPWYRKVLLKSAHKDEYEVMKTTRQGAKTRLKNWPRETRKVRPSTKKVDMCLSNVHKILCCCLQRSRISLKLGRNAGRGCKSKLQSVSRHHALWIAWLCSLILQPRHLPDGC